MDPDYLFLMKLSRQLNKTYEEVLEIDEQELWRQKAFDELYPMEDSWMQTCWLIEMMESLVSKNATPAYKRYPGDIFKNYKKPVAKVNRSKHLKRVAEILNKQSGG